MSHLLSLSEAERKQYKRWIAYGELKRIEASFGKECYEKALAYIAKKYPLWICDIVERRNGFISSKLDSLLQLLLQIVQRRKQLFQMLLPIQRKNVLQKNEIRWTRSLQKRGHAKQIKLQARRRSQHRLLHPPSVPSPFSLVDECTRIA